MVNIIFMTYLTYIFLLVMLALKIIILLNKTIRSMMQVDINWTRHQLNIYRTGLSRHSYSKDHTDRDKNLVIPYIGLVYQDTLTQRITQTETKT